MTDYILNGWGNKDLWVLEGNAYWEENAHPTRLITGDDNTLGSAYREVNALNYNWKLRIYNCLKAHYYEDKLMARDVLIFLKNDAKPIIFRVTHIGDYDKNYVYRQALIIYDGVVRAQFENTGPWHMGYFCNFYYEFKITRENSVYTFLGFVSPIFWDYGSEKPPIKIKLRTILDPKYARWYGPNWYYTEPTGLEDDYAFIM